jgi:predicted SPOUT superfamily RNA methylase MTH1
MKQIQVGTSLTVRTTDGRYRHGIVTSVTSQTSVSVSIGKAAAIAVTRASSTTTRGRQFSQ